MIAHGRDRIRAVSVLASGVDYADLRFLGKPQIITTAILHGASGVALVDPGPSSTIANLVDALERRGIAPDDVRWILLTHIHLDHAGATGSWVARYPRVEVVVHEIGARHLIDPSKLLASAARLYGDLMETLWGEFLAVPADRVRALAGGERLAVAGRELEVAYTPGHAKHHVSYLDHATGIAFVGDVAGIRRPPGTYVMPPTPPPDVDLPAWRESADRLLAWRPSTIFLTHFGPYQDAAGHLRELMDRLDEWSGVVRSLLARGDLSDDQRRDEFIRLGRIDLRRHMSDEAADAFDRAGRLDYSWQGLARYWTRAGSRGSRGSPGSQGS
jgi:glyoxylase-like metal-dependent hydrolase (beta-lactamase superfamily II)